jgi:uncharacterized Zn finger protein
MAQALFLKLKVPQSNFLSPHNKCIDLAPPCQQRFAVLFLFFEKINNNFLFNQTRGSNTPKVIRKSEDVVKVQQKKGRNQFLKLFSSRNRSLL